MVVDSSPINMTSLALISYLGFYHRHGIRFVEWVLSSIIEQLVTTKIHVLLLFPWDYHAVSLLMWFTGVTGW